MALVVLDAKPLAEGEVGPQITFTEADVTFYTDELAHDGSIAPVVAGTSLTERQTLEALLIPSANNYAKSLAMWAYGSVSSYLAAARDWLSSHHLTQTTVVDTSGLSPASEVARRSH
jgi:D-alanyl-D-alanine carboxypeptidase (penicillin-binding protein 5/6)